MSLFELSYVIVVFLAFCGRIVCGDFTFTRYELASDLAGSDFILEIEDMNGDGYLDIVLGSSEGMSWYANEPTSDGNFAAYTIASGNVSDISLADVNDDQCIDVLVVEDGEILAYTNHNGTLDTSVTMFESNVTGAVPTAIDTFSTDSGTDIFGSFFDSSTDVVVIHKFSSSDQQLMETWTLNSPVGISHLARIEWFTFSPTQFAAIRPDGDTLNIILTGSGSAVFLSALAGQFVTIHQLLDINGNLREDMLVTEVEFDVPRISWVENDGSQGVVQSIAPGEFAAGGIIDTEAVIGVVVGASDGRITLHRLNDTDDSFDSVGVIVDLNISAVAGVALADMDNDGQADVIAVVKMGSLLSNWSLAYYRTAPSTPSPTSSPTPSPTLVPTPIPTQSPTAPPTALPTSLPSPLPSPLPSLQPTLLPSSLPTLPPTPLSTAVPTPLAATLDLNSTFEPTASRPTPLSTPVPVQVTTVQGTTSKALQTTALAASGCAVLIVAGVLVYCCHLSRAKSKLFLTQHTVRATDGAELALTGPELAMITSRGVSRRSSAADVTSASHVDGGDTDPRSTSPLKMHLTEDTYTNGGTLPVSYVDNSTPGDSSCANGEAQPSLVPGGDATALPVHALPPSLEDLPMKPSVAPTFTSETTRGDMNGSVGRNQGEVADTDTGVDIKLKPRVGAVTTVNGTAPISNQHQNVDNSTSGDSLCANSEGAVVCPP